LNEKKNGGKKDLSSNKHAFELLARRVKDAEAAEMAARDEDRGVHGVAAADVEVVRAEELEAPEPPLQREQLLLVARQARRRCSERRDLLLVASELFKAISIAIGLEHEAYLLA
jgi:hypothetical protein